MGHSVSVVAAAFDRIATSYDVLWTKTAIGVSQRNAIWQRIDGLFKGGSLILDLGCGTGEDALHLHSRGVEVYGVDASASMVEIARRRGVNAYQLAAEDISELNRTFDGAICNFGVLNCINPLENVAALLGEVIRPKGYLAVCVMGRYCLWETFYFLLHGNVRKAIRRFTGEKAESSIGVAVQYETVKRIRQVFGANFKLINWYGIGLCVPPSYVRHISTSIIYRLAQLDRLIAHWPFFRGLSDHRLFIFKRV